MSNEGYGPDSSPGVHPGQGPRPLIAHRSSLIAETRGGGRWLAPRAPESEGLAGEGKRKSEEVRGIVDSALGAPGGASSHRSTARRRGEALAAAVVSPGHRDGTCGAVGSGFHCPSLQQVACHRGSGEAPRNGTRPPSPFALALGPLAHPFVVLGSAFSTRKRV